MFAALEEDIAAVMQRDPAARSRLQILLFYAGLHAIWLHRIANRLWRAEWHLLAYAIAFFARWLTGIEIHPAAQIGPRFFIDHGMGVVIGETAEIGADVTLYHGVTLGGVSLVKGKRHPTLEDHVVVGAGAKVLGAITIGRGSRIGANSVVVNDVEPNKVVVGVPGKVITRQRSPAFDFQHNQLPDVLSDQLIRLSARVNHLEALLEVERAPEREPDYMI
jgi:serine O-acetyltransferase